MSQTLTLTKIESRLFLREWTSLFFVFALPAGLLTIFSLLNTGADDGRVPASFLPTMAIGIGVGILGMATLSMILAGYRENGVLRRMSTTPARPIKVLIAQLLVHLGAAAAVIVVILGLGKLAFGHQLPDAPVRFTIAALLYCVSQLSLGLLIASLVPTAKGASMVGNILFFPSMFFAGVWTPGDLMPESLRWLRDVTPMGAGMSSLQDTWAGDWPDLVHVVSLVVTTAICLTVAARTFRWQ